MSLKQQFLEATVEPMEPLNIEGFPELWVKVLSASDIESHTEIEKKRNKAEEFSSILWLLVSLCDADGNLIFDIDDDEDYKFLHAKSSAAAIRKVADRIFEVNKIGEDSVEEEKND